MKRENISALEIKISEQMHTPLNFAYETHKKDIHTKTTYVQSSIHTKSQAQTNVIKLFTKIRIRLETGQMR